MEIVFKVNLGKRDIQLSLICDFFGKEEEDVQYIFRFFELAQQTWRGGSLVIHSKNERIGFCSISGIFTARMVKMVQELFTLSVCFGLYGCQGTAEFSDMRPPPRTLLDSHCQVLNQHGILQNQNKTAMCFLGFFQSNYKWGRNFWLCVFRFGGWFLAQR